MKIIEVYKRFTIPPNLQAHMIRVFGIICFIEKHWSGPWVDWQLTKKMALLHDMGNIIKFDMNNNPEFMGSEKVNINYWKQVQKDFINKYGNDDEEATRQILREIGIDEQIINTIFSKSFGNSVAVSSSYNWSLKLLYYADLRTLPLKIGTLEERLIDVKNRMPKYTARSDFEQLVQACKHIGFQIQKYLNIPDIAINDKSASINRQLAEDFPI